MDIKKRATVKLENPPIIIATAAIGGKNEGEGPIADYLDEISGV